jgi:hypothetical protein
VTTNKVPLKAIRSDWEEVCHVMYVLNIRRALGETFIDQSFLKGVTSPYLIIILFITMG